MQNILILGGTGFVGRHVVNALVDALGTHARITVATRRRDRARQLMLLPTVDVIEADIHDDAQLTSLMIGKTAVVNLVGILHSRGGSPYGPDFAKAHVRLVERVIAAMRHAGVMRLLHMSALGANLNGPSMYSRSKAAGEALVRASGLDWTIFQPSVVFGPDDRFLNTFAGLARWFPIIPLAGSSARLQPVYVIDVAAAFVAALARPDCFGQSLVLVGPRIYTLKELVQFAGLAAIGKLRPVLPLPMVLGKLQAMLFEMLPGEPLISRDNLDSLTVDNISGDDGLEALGITAHPMEPVAAQYLAGRNPRTRYDRLRVGAGR